MSMSGISSSTLGVLTISRRLGALIAVVAICFLAAAGVYGWLDARTQQVEREAVQAEHIAREALVAEGQLLLAKDRATAFFRSKRPADLEAHAQARAEARKQFESIATRASGARDIVEALSGYEAAVDTAAALRRQLGLNENEGLEGTLRKAVHGIETRLEAFRKTADADAMVDSERLLVTMLMMRRHEKDFMMRGDAPRYVGLVERRLAEFEQGLKMLRADAPTREALSRDVRAYVETLKTYAANADRLSGAEREVLARFDNVLPRASAFIAREVAKSTALRRAADEATAELRQHLLMLLVASMLVIVTLGFLIARSIARPIVEMTQTMRSLAGGTLDVAVPGLGRRDEIGQMAGAVEVFRENAQERQRLTEETRRFEQSAAEQRRAVLNAMAEAIERETSIAVDEMGEHTKAMISSTEAMTVATGSVGEEARTVAGAAQRALENASTVTSAAEELTASIREISRRIADTKEVTRAAVDAGRGARGTIEELAGAIEKIEDFARVIGEIAAQTNLLALNATIEAARAGDVGRGFAVVAGEVKNLATQASRSTEDITRQIGEIRDRSQAAVAAVSSIDSQISRIDEVTAAVAAAAEEQTAATGEIAKSISDSASIARDVAHRIDAVADAAARTRDGAQALESTAGEVDGLMRMVREGVIRTVRSASSDVERRRWPRVKFDGAVTLEIEGRNVSVPAIDVSAGGIRLAANETCRVGQRCRVRLPGLDVALPADVLALSGSGARLRFDIDEPTRARLSALIEARLPKDARAA
jgi:methyl-accepting chemotaxis protein